MQGQGYGPRHARQTASRRIGMSSALPHSEDAVILLSLARMEAAEAFQTKGLGSTLYQRPVIRTHASNRVGRWT